MLVLVIGAFFYGLKIGKEDTEMKYQALLFQQEEIPPELTAYHQQHLVSFYHIIYLPYRDYQKKWFEHIDLLQLRSDTVDPQSSFNELKRLADSQYASMSGKHMPDTSPLLQESQKDYMRSLRLFSEAFTQMQLNDLQGHELIQAIENDVYFQEAKQHALSAQHYYYQSILRWNQSIETNLTFEEIFTNELSINQWNSLNLNQKNSYIAYVMLELKSYQPYYVQDVTIRVDELVMNGQAQSMELTVISEIMQTLINTGAVRMDDFIFNKNRYYQDESLPQLPFFYEQN